MSKLTTLTTLLCLIALTAKAQLTDWQNISSKNIVTKIIHDANYLYVGTKGGGIVKIHKKSGEQTVLKRADGSMTGNSITDMALRREYDMSASERRAFLQQEGDAGRFRV